MDLHNKTVLLTGASGGIGVALAELLAAQGARLLLSGRNENALTALRDSLPGSRHQVLCADLSSPDSLQKLALKAATAGVDILINNAGIGELSLVGEMDETNIQRLIDLNLGAPIKLTNALLPALKQRPQAAIVNIGSILGSIGLAGNTTYCASKFGLRGFSEALRRELSDSQVRVIYFAPRATATDFNDGPTQAMNRELGNQVDPAHTVAEALIRVLQKNTANYRYLGWPEKLFVRINSLLPRIVDGAVKKQLPVVRRYARSQLTKQS